MTSINVPHKKRGRPATGETPRVGVRLPPELREVVETHATELGITKSEAIRAALEEWAKAHNLIEQDPSHTERPLLFRISTDLLDRLVAYAAANDMTAPDAIPMLIEDALNASTDD